MDTAFILFAHGARDSRWSLTLGELEARLARRLPQARVVQAFLEFQAPDLAMACAQVLAKGVRKVRIVPVFWAQGGHMANDVPLLLARLRATHPEASFELLPVLSELPGMLDFIAETVAAQE